MWVIAGILLVTILIFAFEVPPLWKKKKKKELIVFSFLLLFGTGLSIAKSLDIKIPNPLDFITFIYKPISDVMMNFFK
ncbi:glucan phosphoethanolaminetransferase (alkaline phosphatase superfamily) [Bacillus pakistanensis]|uniref:Glucan phosphoethanolaminetransferase (Alkaline phosphatase superfamily) n=1 Tax=Rossellomorea pakistanensis TaxID=992288 RepID=A0ABS2NDH9_9BACI|nr:hypothetical protein [Bacillus pakistanensis]MBM7585626.1 glucan phosphoethanolaminetransferase (alkaline phosphatase superfamily) [Bacillus pakistanensis]